MRPATLGGILLVILGLIVLTLGIRYPHQEKVLDLGDLEAKVTEHNRVPDWVGVATIAGGVLLIGAGTIGRRASR